MESYYKVIDNMWGEDCATFKLEELEAAIEYAKDSQESAIRNNKKEHDGSPFKVMLIKLTSEIIDF